MQFEEYLSNLPMLHTWDEGQTFNSGGFEEEHLTAFFNLAKGFAEFRFLETGAGNSTITFLMAGALEVTSVAPDSSLFGRIEDYCRKRSISIENLSIQVGLSEWVLPQIVKKPAYDIILIDGAHGWPHTFIDLFYANIGLKQGGFLILDDLQLHSVKEIARFLKEDSDKWEVTQTIGKVGIFRKLTDSSNFPDWLYQPYIKRQSDANCLESDPYDF